MGRRGGEDRFCTEWNTSSAQGNRLLEVSIFTPQFSHPCRRGAPPVDSVATPMGKIAMRLELIPVIFRELSSDVCSWWGNYCNARNYCSYLIYSMEHIRTRYNFLFRCGMYVKPHKKDLKRTYVIPLKTMIETPHSEILKMTGKMGPSFNGISSQGHQNAQNKGKDHRTRGRSSQKWKFRSVFRSAGKTSVKRLCFRPTSGRI